jgi:hypothetical protein
MNFLDLNDAVKFTVSKLLTSDGKIRTMLSKYHDRQKILFEEIVFDDGFCKRLKLQNDVKENDDFKRAIIYKIHTYVCVCVCVCVCVALLQRAGQGQTNNARAHGAHFSATTHVAG